MNTHLQTMRENRDIKSPDGLEQFDRAKADAQGYQGTLVFHNTVPLSEDKLPKAVERAQSQKEAILRLFEKYPDRWFSPYEMMDIYTSETGKRILITSVRRSITDLTKEFRLVKGGKDNQVDECQGSPNNRWKYASLKEGFEAFCKDELPPQESFFDILKDMGYKKDDETEDFNRILNESI